MTGAIADRFMIKKRGYLKEGYMADITIVDWKNVKDNKHLDRNQSNDHQVLIMYS